VRARLSSALRPQGLDLCCPLAALAYNTAVGPELRMLLPTPTPGRTFITKSVTKAGYVSDWVGPLYSRPELRML